MTEPMVPPALILISAGLLILAVPPAVRRGLLVGAPLAALWAIWAGPEGVWFTLPYLGLDLAPVRVDALSRVFGTIFSLVALAGGLFAWEQRNRWELGAAFVYAGASLGAVFAGDLVSLFISLEIMAIASALVIWQGGEPARGPGLRYAVLHILGGVLLLVGAAGHVAMTGSVAIEGLSLASPAGWAVLGAVLINAGAWPLSAWVADAYPAASWSGMVFLSAFTTKSSVYILLRAFPGEEVLIWVGLGMIVYGIVYAVLENDMRRILAYSIVNQVGFMVVAAGIGSPLAINGAAAHAFVHILYKALLLMAAGSVLFRTGRSRLSELGGLGRRMPFTAAAAAVGAATALAFPLTAGFASKAMISSAAGEAHLLWAWLGITAGSAAVILNAGLKFPWFVFFDRDSGLEAADPPWPMRAAMALVAALCLGVGVFYGALYAILPYGDIYAPYTGAHIVSQLQILLFAALGFFLLRDWMRGRRSITLDTDWLWRRGGEILADGFHFRWLRASEAMAARSYRALRRFFEGLYRTHGPESLLARTRPSGAMTVWMTVLLIAFLLFSFV